MTMIKHYPAPIAMLPTDLTMHEELIEVVLAHPNKWTFEPKVDGFRLLTMVYKDHLECYTRNQNRLEKVEAYLARNMNWGPFTNYIVDGEIFEDNIRQTMSIVTGPLPITRLQYYIFDIIPIQYSIKDYTVPLQERRQLLKHLYNEAHPTKFIIRMPFYNVRKRPEQIKDYLFDTANKFVAKGYEGIVIKRYDSPYEHRRTLYWLKVKKVYSLDLRCIRVVESKNHPGLMGAIVVDVCGVPSMVGSGFTYQQRVEFWHHPDHIVGKIVEVKFFEKTPNGKLRHPVFVRIRDDKTRPDC